MASVNQIQIRKKTEVKNTKMLMKKKLHKEINKNKNVTFTIDWQHDFICHNSHFIQWKILRWQNEEHLTALFYFKSIVRLFRLFVYWCCVEREKKISPLTVSNEKYSQIWDSWMFGFSRLNYPISISVVFLRKQV